MIMYQNLPASCCNCRGSDVLLIRISTKIDVDLCVTFLNVQAGSIWEDLVNVITIHKLPVSSCNLTVVFSRSKSWRSSILTFVWPFWTFNLAQGQVTLWKCYLLSNWMHHVVTLQRYSPHQNLRQVRYWPLSDHLK